MVFHFYSRRQFIQICAGATAALGLKGCGSSGERGGQDSDQPDDGDQSSDTEPGEDTNQSDDTESTHDTDEPPDVDQKPALVWLEAQDCAGCTESVFSCIETDLKSVLLKQACFRYHEILSAATGEMANLSLEGAIAEGGYILVVEGAFPQADPRYLQVQGEPLEDTFVAAARHAAIILAVGACAAFGAIPKAGLTAGQGVQYVLKKHGIDTPLINLPGCPVHPKWFFNTVNAVLEGAVPELDELLRPIAHFGVKVHDRCPRAQYNEGGRFLTDWNNAIQKSWCLYQKGCKGQATYADCPSLLWNNGANWCIGSGAPCSGCTEPKFCNEWSPVYLNSGV